MWGAGRSAFAFPFRGIKSLLMGGALGLLLEALFVLLHYLLVEEPALALAPIASAANFPAFGYAFLILKTSLEKGEALMPPWEQEGSLALQGLLLALIGLGYGALPFTFTLIGFSLLVRGGGLLLMGMVFMALGILAGLFTGFFLPMGLACYAKGGRVEAAFRPRLLWARIDTILGEYLVAYFSCMASWLLGGIAAALPLVGALLWPFLAFYLLVIWAHRFGRLCAKALTHPSAS